MKDISALITISALYICISPVSAQITFEKWYGGPYIDYGCFAAQTVDTGYIVTGGWGDMLYALRTNSNGDVTWQRTYDLGDYQTGTSGVYTSDDGFAIVGAVDWYSRNNDVLWMKADYNGNLQWPNYYGTEDFTEWGNAVQQTFEGGYIIAGYAYTQTASADIYFIKTEYHGWRIWTKYLGGTLGDYGTSVMQTSDSGYIVAGYTNSYGAGESDVYLIKADENGDTVWTKTYGGASIDQGNSVAQTSDGGYIIAGTTESYGSGGDVYLIRADENGDTVWTKTYGGVNNDQGNSVAQTTDGGYIVAGYTNSYGAGESDVYLVKTDENGDTIWTRTYGGVNNDQGNSVAQTIDGGYILAGTTNSYGVGGDVYLIKTDENGNVGINEEYKRENPLVGNQLSCSSNPFRNDINIFYTTEQADYISIKIFNALGNCIKIINDEWTYPGVYNALWDGCDDKGHKMPSGVYYVVMEKYGNMIFDKVILLR